MAASLADTVTYYYTPCAGVWQAHGAGQAGKIRNGPGRLNSAGRAPDLADGCRLRAARSRPPCIAVSQGGGQCLRKPARAAPVQPSPAGVVTPPCNAGQTGGKASPARGGRCAAGRRRRGAAPCLANILPADTNLSGGRERPPYKVRQACSTAGDDKPPRASAQGPMRSSARRRA